MYFFSPCFPDYPWSPLYEHQVIYFYRRGNRLTSKRFVRKRTWKGNILSTNCSKFNFVSLCPYVRRQWYSGEHSCLPSSWPGFDSRPTHHFVLAVALKENIAHGSSDDSLISHACTNLWNNTTVSKSGVIRCHLRFFELLIFEPKILSLGGLHCSFHQLFLLVHFRFSIFLGVTNHSLNESMKKQLFVRMLLTTTQHAPAKSWFS